MASKSDTKPTPNTPKPSTNKKKRQIKNQTTTSNTPAVTISNYPSALKWLYTHNDFERQRVVHYNPTEFSLDRMRNLLRFMGEPHQQLRFVHVAGTKGKGSVTAMVASMLQSAGYTIGTYTSPHLTDLRERIQINGQLISHAALTETFKTVKAAAKQLEEGKPTFFEIMTAAAFQHFADEAVDLVILETGMGGRLDSTNVVDPELSVITEISLDHTHILGDSLDKIAAEKAGIIKPETPVLTMVQDVAVETVFKQIAEQHNAPITIVGKDIDFTHRFEANRELGPHSRICLTTPHHTYDHVPVPLKGEHQARNCALAIAVADKLQQLGFKAEEEKLIEGLAATKLPGRMEMVWTEPRITIDGAHNPASLAALMKSLGPHIPFDSLVLIFGCGQDKDIPAMLEEIKLGADKVIFTRAKGNPRAAEPADLLAAFNAAEGKMAQMAPTLEAALSLAARAVGREDLICVTGSFYLAGEAKKYLTELAANKSKQNA